MTARSRLEVKKFIFDRLFFSGKAWGTVKIKEQDASVRDPLREKAKAAQGKWDPKTRARYIQFGKIKDTELEKFIIS
jgi:hypothetical protein